MMLIKVVKHGTHFRCAMLDYFSAMNKSAPLHWARIFHDGRTKGYNTLYFAEQSVWQGFHPCTPVMSGS